MRLHKCTTKVNVCAPQRYVTNISITEEAKAHVPECTRPQFVDIMAPFCEAASINIILTM